MFHLRSCQFQSKIRPSSYRKLYGRYCFTTVLASNIAKWKIKSHTPAEQHAAVWWSPITLSTEEKSQRPTCFFVEFLLAQCHITRTDGIQVTRKRASKIGSWSCEVSQTRERTTNRHSELHILQILFQIRSIYHQNDLQIEVSGPMNFELKI